MEKYKLKDICQVLNGRAYKQAELLQEGKYKVLRVGNFFTSDRWYYSDMELDENKYCDNDDLLYAWSASFGPKLWEGGKTIYHYHIWKMIPDLHKVNKYYLYYWLLNNANQLTAGTHGSVMAHITKSSMENQDIELPNLDIQFKVSDMLHTIDEKINTNEKINRNLADQVSAIYKSWFVDFELYDGVCPDTWKTATLGDLAEISSGKRPPMKQTDKTDDVTIPLVGAASIMGYTNEVLYDSKILVTGRVGTHGVIQRFNEKCWPSDNTLVITTARYEFVYQILQGIDYTSMNRGSTQPLITQGDLKKTEIIIPTVDVLDKFEVLAGGLMEQYEKNRVENINLAELRDTLLPKLMSGELDVSEIDL